VPLLSRSDILAAADLKFEEVDVPEWGGTVRVRELTGTQRDQIEAAMVTVTMDLDDKGKKTPTPEFDKSSMETFRARIASYSIVDDSNQRIFTDADIFALGEKGSAALQRVYDVALRISGFSQTDVEELVGNSDAAQSGASTSDSPSPSDAPQ